MTGPGPTKHVQDGLQSLVAELGTLRDKSATVQYVEVEQNEQQLIAAYRSSWLARKIVDVPALDTFRAWRSWQGAEDEIESLEKQEETLGLQGKLLRAYRLARLFGVCHVYFDLGDNTPERPVTLSRVGKDGIRFMTVLSHRQLAPGKLEQDPLSSSFGLPKWYSVVGATASNVRIHPDRLITFYGADRPEDDHFHGGIMSRGGDSVLLPLMQAIQQFDATAANLASLVFEAKIDVIMVKGLTSHIAGNPLEEQRMMNRYRLAAQAKGNNGMLILDGDSEEYQQKTYSFAALADIMDRFAQNAAGSADIPMTRLFGQSPAGMSATGESDLRNYYDRISANQTLGIAPALQIFNECLIRAALGSRPPELHVLWKPLWQISSKERSELGRSNAATIKTLKDTGLIPDEVLATGVVNMMTQDGVIPGLESEYTKFFEGGGEHDFDADAAEDSDTLGRGQPQEMQDEQPRIPKGSPGGGQWTKGGGGGSSGGSGVTAAAKAVATSKYSADKVMEVVNKDPKTLSHYEKKVLAKYKKAQASAPAEAPAQPPKQAPAPVTASKGGEVGEGLSHFGSSSKAQASASISDAYGVTGEQYENAKLKPEQFKVMSYNELLIGAEYAYDKGDADILTEIFKADPSAALAAAPIGDTDALKAQLTSHVAKTSAKPEFSNNTATGSQKAATKEAYAAVQGTIDNDQDTSPSKAMEAVKKAHYEGALSNGEYKELQGKLLAKAEMDAQVAASKYAMGHPDHDAANKLDYDKKLAEVAAIQKPGVYKEAVTKQAASAGFTPVEPPTPTPTPTPTPAAAISTSAAQMAALNSVATSQYPAEKVQGLLSKDPKTLTQYEKKKLSAYKKALQAGGGTATATAAAKTDPNSAEAKAYFAKLGSENYGMKPETVQKLATGEWTPEPGKAYQTKVAEAAKAYLATGKVPASAPKPAAPKPAAYKPTVSLETALDTSPPPTTTKSKPQTEFAGYADLTSKESANVTTYTGGSHADINHRLRNDKTPHTATAGIDAAIAKAYAKTDMVVVRGVSSEAFGKLVATAKTGELKPGHVITDKGFMSTTRKAGTASGFAGYQGYGLKISVPKGAPLLPVKSISQHASEDEFLLPRGSKLKVVSFDPATRVVHVALVV